MSGITLAQFVNMPLVCIPYICIYTGTLEYKQLGREYVVIHWQRLSGDRIQMEARFSAHVQTAPTAYPASYTLDTGSLSWG